MTRPELNNSLEEIDQQPQLPPEGLLGGQLATFKETIRVVDPSDPSKGYVKVLTGELVIPPGFEQPSAETE